MFVLRTHKRRALGIIKASFVSALTFCYICKL